VARHRARPGWGPHRRAGAARGVARQRPGAGGGACGGGRGRRGGGAAWKSAL